MSLSGLDVVVSPMLGLPPLPGEDGRRIVRHGMAGILAWLGEDVGPKPGEPTHVVIAGRTAFISEKMNRLLRERLA